jgi:two-component system phosphate regulon response regulator PhoB
MSKQKILVIEDERDLVEVLTYNLTNEGFEVHCATDGQDVLRRAQRELPDLILLDLMLPVVDGLQVCRQLRSDPRTQNLRILMLTARSEDIDEIVGFNMGADDYVTKPFSMKVLLARVEALLRRNRASSGQQDARDVLSHGPVRVDLSNHEAWVASHPVKLTLTEFRLLVALLRKPGKAIRRADLMYSAMGPGVLVTARTIDVHMAAIRKKLGESGGMIRTVRGVGYLIGGDSVVSESVEAGSGAQVE